MPDLAYVSTALDKIMREAKDQWSAENWTGVAHHARFAELLTNQTSDNEDEPVIELPDDMTPWQLSGLDTIFLAFTFANVLKNMDIFLTLSVAYKTKNSKGHCMFHGKTKDFFMHARKITLKAP